MIHQFKQNGYNIVLDINSGAIHIVDEISYDIINLYKTNSLDNIKSKLVHKYNTSEIEEAYNEVKLLESSKELFTEDIYENYISKFTKRETVVKAMCLHIAHDCNLACKYCFAEEGEYHGRKAIMSYEVGKAAIDFLIANSGNRHNLEIDFFGGEPLLNFKVVKKLVEYGRSLEKQHNKNFRFTLTTNGILLNDEIMDFCNREMANVVLSIDGRKEINDNMRPFRNKKGSYDIIVPKFMKFANSRNQDKYYVRGTFTKHNLDFANDVLHLADLGFKQISVEPVVAQEYEEYALTMSDIDYIKNEYDRLANEMIKRNRNGNGFNFFHFMMDLTQGPCVAKRLSGCGSGTEYLAVTPWGDLYPCHQFVGEEDFKLGDVFTGIKRHDLTEKFKCTSVYSKPDCKNCFAKFYCSGGCCANSNKFYGDLVSSYHVGCELERKRVECAITIQIAQLMKNEDDDMKGAYAV